MAGGTTRTGLTPILQALVTQMVALNVVQGPSNVLVLARQPETVPHMIAEQDMLIWPRGFSVGAEQVASAGRYSVQMIRGLTVICRTRLHLDEPNRDFVWLTDQTFGHLLFEENAMNALVLFWPTNAQNEALLRQPMIVKRGDSLTKSLKDGAWGSSALDCEIQYDLAVDQTVQ